MEVRIPAAHRSGGHLRAALAAALLAVLPGTARPGQENGGRVEEPCAAPAPGGPGVALDRDLGGDRRLCVRADPDVRLDEADGRIRELPEGRGLTLAVVAGAASRWLRVRRSDGATLHEWRVDRRRQPFDDGARAWMEEALAIVAQIRRADAARAEVERLRGEIDSLVESARRLKGEIGALLAERGRLQREIGGIRAEDRELRTRIAAVRGEESALRVAAGGHRTAIASLTAELEDADPAQRDEIEQERERRRAALDAIEARLRREDHAGRVRELEARLAGLRTEARVDAVESRIATLEVDDRVEELEERIARLRVPERSAALRRRLDDARERLEALRRRLAPRLERLAPVTASPPGGPP